MTGEEFLNHFKTKKALAVGLICAGSMLALQGYIFYYYKWDDLFFGLITGPIMIIIGILILSLNKKQKIS